MNALDASFNFHESSLRLRAQRQELLAGNIANADTPNYKARDLDFSAALKSAVSNNSQSVTLGNTMKPVATSAMHIGANNAATPADATDIQYRGILQGSVDGNTVDMDVERNQFADNAIRYEASVMMISGKIKQMLSAIQGQ